MPKLKLLILDAGVVIKLHELEVWSALVSRCEVHLSSIVAYRECKYYQCDGDDWGEDLNLQPAIDAGEISVFDVPVSVVAKFKSMFAQNYFADMDDGEAQSLAYLYTQAGDYRISSGDAIVYKVLGNLNMGEQGISLEEVLLNCGMTRRLDERQYTKAFREHYTKVGARDMILGQGRIVD